MTWLGRARFWLLGLGLILGVSSQCFAFFLIFFDLNSLLGLQQNIVASLLLAVAYKELLPRPYRMEPVRTMLLLYGFFLFFPLIGLIGLVISFSLPAYFLRKGEADKTHVVIDFPIVPNCVSSGVEEVNGDDFVGIQKCQLMMLASQRVESKESISLIRKELCNPVDEIRLLAYSLLDRKAKHLNDRIALGLKNIDVVVPKNKYFLYERLAYDHWELVYLGLVQGSVVVRMMHAARQHVVLALASQACNQDRASLHLLLARIALRMDDSRVAMECLRQAEKEGMPKVKLQIYWKEAYFLKERLGY